MRKQEKEQHKFHFYEVTATKMLQLSNGREEKMKCLQSLIVSPQWGCNAQPGRDQVTGCMDGRAVS